MEIYLIRHTKPNVIIGTCYGQSDLDVDSSFIDEMQAIKEILPNTIEHVVSSPLQRCSKLAESLFGNKPIVYDKNLMEINCGDWEMKLWNNIPREVTDKWMANFVHNHFPNGENYVELYNRVVERFNYCRKTYNNNIAIVSHGGVMRSILSYLTQTDLANSFNEFKINYGAVIKINSDNSFEYLHNPLPKQKEQHKPT